MKNLNISTGVVTYVLNDNVEVSFNPTDANFVERLYDLSQSMDGLQEKYEKRFSDDSDMTAKFVEFRNIDADMRNLIDETFGKEICKPLFGDLNVFALADDMPLWLNLIFAIMDEVNAATGSTTKVNAKIEKYTAKYRRK